MNCTIAIALTPRAASELSFRLSTICDRTDEELKEYKNPPRDDLEQAIVSLDHKARPGQKHVLSQAMWELLADEAYSLGFYGTEQRIRDTLKYVAERTTPPKLKVIERPKPTREKHFFNSSRIPTATIKAWVDFIREGHRMPKGFKLTLFQGHSIYTKGNGASASRISRYSRYGDVRPIRSTVRGGSVFIRVNKPHNKKVTRGGHGGYLPITTYGADEDVFATLAHEIRHVFQGCNRIARECRRVRRHCLGTSGKLIEVDASLFAIRALRRFRREYQPTA